MECSRTLEFVASKPMELKGTRKKSPPNTSHEQFLTRVWVAPPPPLKTSDRAQRVSEGPMVWGLGGLRV